MPRSPLLPLLAFFPLVAGALPASTEGSTFHCEAENVACLIAAIAAANTNGEPANTIRLSPGTYTLNAIDNDTHGPNGLPSVASTLTITADIDGSDVLIVRAVTAPSFRFLHAGSGAVLNLHGITLSGGNLTASLPAGSSNGAALYMAGAQVTLTHAALIGNRTSAEGGAIYSDGGTLTVTDTRITDNGNDNSQSAVRTLGGTVTFVRSELARNRGTGGGALWASKPELLWMEDTRFIGNDYIFYGGALFLDGGAGVLVRMTFERNIADSSGVVVHDANLVVRDSSFVENRGGAGGGPLVVFGSTGDIVNTTFVRNKVSPTFGYVIHTQGSLVNLVNSTITGNVGHRHVFGGTATLQNTIVQHADPPFMCVGPPTVTSLGHNIFDGAAALCDVALHPSDVTGDPGLGAFVDTGVPGGGHVPLLAGSPAIDAADTSACPVNDQLGRTRVGPCDIGAVEYPGSVGGLNPSPSGTRLPPAPAIIDSELASWTIGPNLETLRNGVHAGGGYGSTYLSVPGRALRRGHRRQLVALDGQRLDLRRPQRPGWRPEHITEWNAAATGDRDRRQRSGVVDDRAQSGDTAERGARRRRLRLDYLWYEGVLYVVGTDANWWRWTGSGWIFVGANDPAGGPSTSPSGTRLPPATAIVDNDLASWTIGPNLETLRNGVHAGGGYGSSYLWYENVLYVVGTDDNWWRWTGSGWIFAGPIDPSS